MKELLKTLLKLILVLGIVVGLFSIRINYITVEGNIKYDDTTVISKIFENSLDRISFILFLKDKLLHHKNITYVEKYEIIWNNPSSINIVVYEKETIGFVKSDIKNVYFDKDGVINEITSERKPGIIEIRGINFKRYVEGEKLVLENKVLLNALLNITSILKSYNLPCNLLEYKDLNFLLYCDKIKVELGDTKNMEIKLQRLNDIYPEIKDLQGTLDLTKARDNMIDEKYIFKKQ